MKKFIIIMIAVLATTTAQSQSEIRRNTISFQTGIWQNGLMGLSYHRHFPINEYVSTSVGISGGLGMGWKSGGWFGSVEANIYAGGDLSMNFGKEELHFLVGIQPKYVNISLRSHYEGFGALPYVGLSSGFSDFTAQFRAGALFFDDNLERLTPSIGLSFGYSF